MRRVRMWTAGLALTAVGAFLLTQGGGAAQPDKELAAAMDKVVEAFQKGDKDGAKKHAEAVAKKIEEVHEVMDLFRPRNKGGWGVGDKAGAIVPDGIEQMLLKVGRDAPAKGTMEKQAAALEQLGYRVAAIAEVAIAKAPKQNKGKQLVKDWVEWSKDTRDAALQFAAAAKMKSGADVKAAAGKANNACNACHTIFR